MKVNPEKASAFAAAAAARLEKVGKMLKI